MAFNRPTLADLVERVKGDFRSALDITTVLLRSFINVIVRILAGLAHLLFGFLDFIARQAFPDSAEKEFLERHAGIWGVTRLQATFAQFALSVTGTIGTVIPVNTLYQAADGSQYTVDDEVTLDGAPDLLQLTAVEAGSDSNPTLLDVISIVSPIAGLDSDGIVDTITIEASNVETDEALRVRLLDRIQNPPSGGTVSDYVQFAKNASASVTRVFITPDNTGPGSVGVSFVEDGEVPITPDAAKLTEVFDFIETLRPVTANVNVFAPVLAPITFTIKIKPNTTAVQGAIATELADMILRDSAVVGSVKGPGETHDGKILLSRINEAISISLGEEDHEITLINGVAPADVVPTIGQLATLGVITWLTLV